MGELPYCTMSGDVFIPVVKDQMQRLCLRLVGYDQKGIQSQDSRGETNAHQLVV